MLSRLSKLRHSYQKVRYYYNTSLIKSGPDVKTIDFRTDAGPSKPSVEMYERMMNAQLGDDYYKEDPTVNEFELKCAELFGMEKALFTPSGTMGNLVCIMAHCRERGQELIIGHKQHAYTYEQNHFMQLGGIPARVIPNNKDGTVSLQKLQNVIYDGSDFHQCKTQLICIENTFNGTPLSFDYLQEMGNLAKSNQLKLHVDGARLYNAAVALKCDVKDLLKHTDSVSMCLSKGLSCPIGAIIGGSAELIDSAKHFCQALGGGLAQAGIMAAAGLYALEHAQEILSVDHYNAQLLAHGINENCDHSVVHINPQDVHTNILFLETPQPIAAQLSRQLWYKGILQLPYTSNMIRCVLHSGISEIDVRNAVTIISNVANNFQVSHPE